MSQPQNNSGTAGEPSAPTRGGGPWPRLFLDAAVALVLCGVLVTVYALDRGPPPPPQKEEPPPEPPEPPEPVLADLTPEPEKPIDPTPRLRMGWTDNGRFGLVRATADPDDPTDTDTNKRLTFSSDGATNNTCVWVDGQTPTFGDKQAGHLLREPARGGANTPLEWLWRYKEIEVTQLAELVAGDVSRRMDTVKVTYTLHNRDDKNPHEVGLRAMIDTFIGSNDGVPFFAPGAVQGVIERPFVFGIGPDFSPGPTTGKVARPFVFGVHPDIPPFVRALEHKNVQKHGVVVNIGGLRPKQGESPAYVVLSHWPGHAPGNGAPWGYPWDAPFTDPNNIQDNGDSSIGLYYPPRPLGPGEKRAVQFTYGLAVQTAGKDLTLTAGTAPQAGGKFYLYALVQSPELNQTVTLELPAGMSLDKDSTTKPVKVDGNYTQVSWLVKVAWDTRGKQQARVRLDSRGKDPVEARTDLSVAPPDSRLELRLASDTLPSNQRSFYVVAYVLNPSPGQEVELQIGGVSGLKLHRDSPARQPVPQTADKGRIGKVKWLVEADASARGDAKLTATLQPGDGRQEAAIKVEPRTLTD